MSADDPARRDGLGPGEPDERAPAWGFEEGAEIAPGRQVLRPLGGGRRHEVFLVWDDELFSLAVAKVVRPHLAEDERVLGELRDEAEALDALAHPVLVRRFGGVLDGPHPHLLLEHVEGPTLRRLVRRGGPVPLEQLLPLVAHLGAALHFMSARGWLHLDVKPDNVVVGVLPRVIDLSIACTVERAARIRSPLGTDAYMAPEQCLPEEHLGEIGPPTDVWGLGATLHHCASGERPFPRPPEARDSPDPLVRFPQLREEPRPLPAAVPDAVRELIADCLAKRPDERPAAAEVVARLEPLAAARPRRLVFGRRRFRER